MNLDLKFYWKLFWRRLPLMTLLVLLTTSFGVISAMKLPETWSTSARLLVEAPQIPDSMVPAWCFQLGLNLTVRNKIRITTTWTKNVWH